MGLNFVSEDTNSYQLEEIKKKNLFTRWRIIILFSIFLSIIFVLVRNDYRLTFNKNEKLELICGPKNTLNSSNDDDEVRREKIIRAVQTNQKSFSTLPNFQKIYPIQEPRGYRGKNIWIVKIIFSEENPEHKKIPEQLCGFNIDILYK